jgi:hypothetical protein
MKSGLRYFCFVFVSLLATQVFAADMSGWSDKTVCRLVKAGGGQEHIEEAKSRGLACGAAVTSTSSDSNNINLQTINPADRVVTSTDQRYHDMCNAFESGVTNELHDGITRLYKKWEQNYSNIGIDVIADLYGDGELEASSIQYSTTQPRLYTQNIKFNSLVKSLNVDKTLGLKFLNEQPKSKEIRKIISGDVNSDNIIDLMFIDYGEHDGKVMDGKVIMLLSGSDGYRWSVLKTKAKKVRIHTGALIDIDNDNDLDLVLGAGGKTPYNIHILENDGKGQFSALNGPRSTRIGSGWVSFTASDIDNDGYHDLIMDWQKQGKLGTQILWGGKYGLFKSLKITKMPYDHTSDKDLLMDAIPYDKSGQKNILFIYAADHYQSGTKLVNRVFSGREITESKLILHRKFRTSQWVNTIYPCQSGLKFHTFLNKTSQSVAPD